MMRVGYYVHHHGAGHGTRAGVIAASLRRRGHAVTLLGSSPPGLAGDVVDLPRDNDSGPWADPHAGGGMHWAPLGHRGYADRMRQLAQWVCTHTPDVVVVDVSVEVTTLIRLLGVPVVVVAQPGRRTDGPHHLAYSAATSILCPWPAQVVPNPALISYAHKVFHVGGISRFGPVTQSIARTGPPVLLGGQSGLEDMTTARCALASLFRTEPVELGGTLWHGDVSGLLTRASVVVAHTGQNAVADVAALRAPLIMVPQMRPHDEQAQMAETLNSARLAVPAPATPMDSAWRLAVAEATQRAASWERWQTVGSADRAASVVEETVR